MATLIGLEGLIGESLLDAQEIQNENRSREMSLVITKLEEADMWLRKLQIQEATTAPVNQRPYEKGEKQDS